MSKTITLLAVILMWTTTSFGGNCLCPSDTKSNGYRCGGASAFCKTGGAAEELGACGVKTEKEKCELMKKQCRSRWVDYQYKCAQYSR